MRFYFTNGIWTDDAGNKLPTSPMQPSQRVMGDLQIPRIVAEEAYKEYAAQNGTGQSFERLCERGGFGAFEMAHLLFDRIKRLEREAQLADTPGPASEHARGKHGS